MMDKCDKPDCSPRRAILVGDAREVLPTLPDQSIDMIFTSPPYWQVRDYQSDPLVWGGTPKCSHEWAEHRQKPSGGKGSKGANVGANRNDTANMRDHDVVSGFCIHCEAWKGQLGLEPDYRDYIENLCSVFDECWPTLKDTGSLYVVIGDTYCGTKSGKTDGKYSGDTKSTCKNLRKKPQVGVPKTSQIGIPERFKIAMIDRGWICRNTIIWCLAQNTKVWVKSQKGQMSMTLKDLDRLDPTTVELWNGEQWTQLLGMGKSKHDDGLKVTLRNGEEINTTPDHQWPTSRGLITTNELVVGDVLRGCQLPESEFLFTPKHLPDDRVGWLIGYYLANGSKDGNGYVQLSCHSDKANYVWSKVSGLCADFHSNVKEYKLKGKSSTINIYGKIIPAIINTYIVGTDAKTKHLTNKTWQRNNTFLRYLINGYLDGDGHDDKHSDRYRLGFTRNDMLADDLRTICSKLGYTIKLQKVVAACQTGKFPAYRGEIRFGFSTHHNTKDDREIVSIKDSKCISYYDLSVEDEPHLFALSSGTLTHNCKPNAMPSSVSDRFTPDYEFVFFFTKSGTPKYWTNHRTKALVQKKPPGLKGDFEDEWDWAPCRNCQGEKFTDDDNRYTKIPPATAESYGSPRARYHRPLIDCVMTKPGTKDEPPHPRFTKQCTSKQCDQGWYRRSVWRSHKYYHEQQLEAYQSSYDSFEYKGQAIKEYEKAMAQNPSDSKRRILQSMAKKGGRNKRSVWNIVTKGFKAEHFAVFPQALLTVPIMASCPEMVCSTCGMPAVDLWKPLPEDGGKKTGVKGSEAQEKQRQKMGAHPTRKDASTTPDGSVYRPPREWNGTADCDCEGPRIPGIVLDPFSGAGTTALAAHELDRDWCIIELKPDYAAITKERLIDKEVMVDFVDQASKRLKQW